MKRLFTLLAFIPVSLVAQTNELVVTGKITGLKENAHVVLTNGATNQQVATAVARNGSFTLRRKGADASVWQVSFPGNTPAVVDFFAANNAVSVTGNIIDLGKAEIKGNAMQEDFAAFKSEFIPYLNQLRALAGQINQERNAGRRDSMMNIYTNTKANALTATVQFVNNKNASPVSAFVLSVMAPIFNSMSEVEGFYMALQPQARTGSFIHDLEKAIADSKIGAIGSLAIDFTQKDVNDKPVTLSSFRGKYVLVDFWASWCGPCRQENPNVVSVYNKYKNKNFTVFGVSLDNSKERWLQAIAADGLTWTNVSDLKYWQNEAALLYRVEGIPANILVDPNGKIVAKNLRGPDLERTLEGLLKSN